MLYVEQPTFLEGIGKTKSRDYISELNLLANQVMKTL